jgi:hypothetical protein
MTEAVILPKSDAEFLGVFLAKGYEPPKVVTGLPGSGGDEGDRKPGGPPDGGPGKEPEPPEVVPHQIDWDPPAPQTWQPPTGFVLTRTQLNARVRNQTGVPVYAPTEGFPLGVGTHTLRATVAASPGYSQASRTVDFTVTERALTLTWNPPSQVTWTTGGFDWAPLKTAAPSEPGMQVNYESADGVRWAVGQHRLIARAGGGGWHAAEAPADITVLPAPLAIEWNPPAEVAWTPNGYDVAQLQTAKTSDTSVSVTYECTTGPRLAVGEHVIIARAGGDGWALVERKVTVNVAIIVSDEFKNKAVEIEKEIKTLEQHPQHAHVANEITTAKSKLQDARSSADTGYESRGRPLLEEAQRLLEAGTGFADRYGKFVLTFAEANRIVYGIEALELKEFKINVDPEIASIRGSGDKAKTRDYDGAKKDIDDALKTLTGHLQMLYGMETGRIKALKGQQKGLKGTWGEGAKTIIDKDVEDIDTLHGQVGGDVALKKWTQAALNGKTLHEMITTATKVAQRRTAYDEKRKAATTRLESAGSHDALAEPKKRLQTEIEAADQLATRDVMRFEAGIGKLDSVINKANELPEIVAAAETYKRERAQADEEFRKLTGEPAAKYLGPQVEKVKEWLGAAQKAVGG